jgi:hypothetical protein
VSKESALVALTPDFVEEGLSKAAFGERQKNGLDGVREPAREAEHLALGTTIERRGHKMHDTHRHILA